MNHTLSALDDYKEYERIPHTPIPKRNWHKMPYAERVDEVCDIASTPNGMLWLIEGVTQLSPDSTIEQLLDYVAACKQNKGGSEEWSV